MTINGIHHIAIICSDYKRSRLFYTEVLGLEILNETYREDRRSFKLDLRISDGVCIELFSFPNPPPRPSYPEACGLRHLAFKVQNIEEALRNVRENGFETQEIRIDEFTGRRFAFFEDPDGLPIEFYEA